MKRRDFMKFSGMGAGALISGLYACEKNPLVPEEEIIPEELTYTNFKKKIISSGIERPSGISMYDSAKKSDLKSSSNYSALEDILFCGGPLINESQTKFFTNPTVFKYQGGLDSIDVLYEFGNEDLELFKFEHMDIVLDDMGMPIRIEGERVYRPAGLNSDTVVLKDGTVLFSTTKANKILDLTGGVKNTYLENDELIGTNNMIYGSDDKVYLAQVAIREVNGEIVRPKRIVSLDAGGNLNVEFELPAGRDSLSYEPIEPGSNSLYGGSHTLYGGSHIEKGSQVRIIENLDKKNDPSKFFVMDQCSRAIYKMDKEGNLENLLDNLAPEVFPSGIEAEIKGNIYYISSPVAYSPHNPNYSGDLAFDAQLRRLDPKKGDDEVLYIFEGAALFTYLRERNPYEVEIGGEKYWLPLNHLMSLGVVEVDNSLHIYYTDNITGDVGVLGATAS